MPLDLGRTVLQIDEATQSIGRDIDDRQTRLTKLLEGAQGVSNEEATTKSQYSLDRPYMAAQITEELIGSKPANQYNGNW